MSPDDERQALVELLRRDDEPDHAAQEATGGVLVGRGQGAWSTARFTGPTCRRS
jgi:hypothetical protein